MKIFYYDLQTLVVMLVVACDQMIDIWAIAADALTCDFDGFQMQYFPNINYLSSFLEN